VSRPLVATERIARMTPSAIVVRTGRCANITLGSHFLCGDVTDRLRALLTRRGDVALDAPVRVVQA
jgi:hypothetical protein